MNLLSSEKSGSVRLSRAEIENFKVSVLSIDPRANIYLFGSRADMAKRGGDIDLLIISQCIKKSDLTHIRWNFFEEFGEQKIDMVLDDGTGKTTFAKMIFPKAVKL